MLADIATEEFAEIEAADVLDPVDDSWQQFGTMAAAVCNRLQRIYDKIATIGGETPPQLEPLRADDFIPMPESVRQIFREEERLADLRKADGLDVKNDHRKRFAGK